VSPDPSRFARREGAARLHQIFFPFLEAAVVIRRQLENRFIMVVTLFLELVVIRC
jgi:hypothetical protein